MTAAKTNMNSVRINALYLFVKENVNNLRVYGSGFEKNRCAVKRPTKYIFSQ